MLKQLAIAFLSVTLGGCSSIGVRYEPPDASQDSARSFQMAVFIF